MKRLFMVLLALALLALGAVPTCAEETQTEMGILFNGKTYTQLSLVLSDQEKEWIQEYGGVSGRFVDFSNDVVLATNGSFEIQQDKLSVDFYIFVGEFPEIDIDEGGQIEAVLLLPTGEVLARDGHMVNMRPYVDNKANDGFIVFMTCWDGTRHCILCSEQAGFSLETALNGIDCAQIVTVEKTDETANAAGYGLFGTNGNLSDFPLLLDKEAVLAAYGIETTKSPDEPSHTDFIAEDGWQVALSYSDDDNTLDTISFVSRTNSNTMYATYSFFEFDPNVYLMNCNNYVSVYEDNRTLSTVSDYVFYHSGTRERNVDYSDYESKTFYTFVFDADDNIVYCSTKEGGVGEWIEIPVFDPSDLPYWIY